MCNCNGPPAFKSKRGGYQSNQKLLHQCITINIKIISSIHIFIFKRQVLGSHELKSAAIFDKAHSKMTKSSFSLPAFVLACKESGYFICSALRYNQFYSPKTWLVTPIFDHAQPMNFWSAFNCYESASTCKNQFTPFVHFSDRVSFRVPSHDWPHPFFNQTNP